MPKLLLSALLLLSLWSHTGCTPRQYQTRNYDLTAAPAQSAAPCPRPDLPASQPTPEQPHLQERENRRLHRTQRAGQIAGDIAWMTAYVLARELLWGIVTILLE